jgi:TRAP-type C4-dicarboxylate transport system permease small subunit
MRRFLGNIVEWIAAAIVVALAIIVFLQVFNRFVLKTPLAWSEDLAMLLFQWVAFLGAAIGVKRMRHFGIELLVKKLPERIHHIIERVIPVIMGIVALTMITEGISLIGFNKNRIYSSMDLSYIWAYLPIPVSGCLMVLYLIFHEVRRWKTKQEGGSHS